MNLKHQFVRRLLRTLSQGSLLSGLFWLGPLSAAASTLNWGWSHPLPHGNNVADMAQSAGFYVQVTERGRVYTSVDLRTWSARPTQTTNWLRSVSFLGERLVIVGENGTVVYGDSAAALTTLSLNTSDWLEGVAASPALAVAVGDNGSIYTSADGASWSKASVSFSAWLRSVAYGTPGRVETFVAVGEEGFVASSTDGQTWTAHGPLSSEHLNRVSWVNDQFVVAGEGGVGFSSVNAQDWVPLASGASNSLNALAGQAGSLLLAGASEVRLSEGSLWMDQYSGVNLFPPPQWTYLSALWDGYSYLLGGRTGVLVEGFKTNATSQTFWLPLDDSPRHWLWDITKLGEVFIAVGDRATILTSLDGIEWTQEVPPAPVQQSILLGVGGSESMAVAVGSGGSMLLSPAALETIVSTNSSGDVTTHQVNSVGIHWHPIEPRPATNDLQGVAFFNNLFVVSGGAGTILTSPDATNWTRRVTPTSQFLSSVQGFPEGIAAVGKGGTILTSTDALTWTARPAPTTDWIYRVRYLGGKLVAVGQNGLILTSTDGRDWVQRSGGTTGWLNDVQWVDGVFFAVGAQGTVLRSDDAINWTPVATITGKSLYGAAEHNGRLVTVGTEGTILRAQVRPITSPLGILRYPTKPSEMIFLVAGEPDQRFTIDRSTDLRDWKEGLSHEIDRTGTSIVIDEQENAPAVQFYRINPKP